MDEVITLFFVSATHSLKDIQNKKRMWKYRQSGFTSKQYPASRTHRLLKEASGEAAYLLIYLIVCKDASFVRHKHTKKSIFLRRQVNLPSVTVYLPPIEIDCKSRKQYHRFFLNPLTFKIKILFQDIYCLIKYSRILIIEFNH